MRLFSKARAVKELWLRPTTVNSFMCISSFICVSSFYIKSPCEVISHFPKIQNDAYSDETRLILLSKYRNYFKIMEINAVVALGKKFEISWRAESYGPCCALQKGSVKKRSVEKALRRGSWLATRPRFFCDFHTSDSALPKISEHSSWYRLSRVFPLKCVPKRLPV